MARVADVQCAGNCGKLLWSSASSLPPGEAKCQQCRSTQWAHGTLNGYQKRGCRCEECTACQAQHRRDYLAKRNAGAYNSKRCTIEGCDNYRDARGMCKMHYRRWARANGMVNSPSEAWSDTRRSNYHARRARLNGGRDGDRVMLADLLERDGAICSWCSAPIDVDLAWPDPLSPSLDHTLPLSRGGDHSMENASAMYLRCNISKGAKVNSTGLVS